MFKWMTGFICIIILLGGIYYYNWENTPPQKNLIEGLTIDEHDGLMFAMRKMAENDPEYELFNKFDMDISGYYNSTYGRPDGKLPDNKMFMGSTSEKILTSYENAFVDVAYTSDPSFNLIASEDISHLGKFFKKSNYLIMNDPVNNNPFTLPVGTTVINDKDLQLQLNEDLKTHITDIVGRATTLEGLVGIDYPNLKFHIMMTDLVTTSEYIIETANTSKETITSYTNPIHAAINEGRSNPGFLLNDPPIVNAVNQLVALTDRSTKFIESVEDANRINSKVIDDSKKHVFDIATSFQSQCLSILDKLHALTVVIMPSDNHLTQMMHEGTLNNISLSIDKLSRDIDKTFLELPEELSNTSDVAKNNIYGITNGINITINSTKVSTESKINETTRVFTTPADKVPSTHIINATNKYIFDIRKFARMSVFG
jgi:hypothetical protein